MRLQSRDFKERNMRLSRWGMERRIAANRPPKKSRRDSRNVGTSIEWVKIQPPERLVFHVGKKARMEFERFVRRVENCLDCGRGAVIDFTDIKRLYPCGLLLLMGLIRKWLSAYPGHLKARYPKDDLAEQMLQHVNVLQDLGLSPRKQVTHNDVNRWFYITGQNVDTGPFNGFMQRVAELAGVEAQAGLYECISEAITNVKHHAYRDTEGDGWWAFCTVSDKKIFVAVLDQGATIPATLLEKQTFEDKIKLRKMRGRRADPELIASAVGGRTRTNLPHRGKGLREMYAFTRGSANSELGIYSRNGFFQYIPLRPQRETSGMINEAVKGTLLIWLIGLTGASS